MGENSRYCKELAWCAAAAVAALYQAHSHRLAPLHVKPHVLALLSSIAKSVTRQVARSLLDARTKEVYALTFFPISPVCGS